VEWESSNVYGGHEVGWRGVDKLTVRDGRIPEEVVYADIAPLQALRRGEKFPARERAPSLPHPTCIAIADRTSWSNGACPSDPPSAGLQSRRVRFGAPPPPGARLSVAQRSSGPNMTGT